MEEPIYKFKNQLRNTLTIVYWISIALCAGLIIIHSNLISNSISILIFGIAVSLILWPIKIFKTHIFVDTIVFKEWGWHPSIKNGFGVAFENIYNYKINRIAFSLCWVVIKRRNGKTIRKLFSLSEYELSEFLKILNEKTHKDNR